jgi:DUF1680 family protein
MAKITDFFWARYIELTRTEMLPYQWEVLNDRIPQVTPSYCIHNLRLAAGLEKGEYQGPNYQESDLGKWIEAVGYVLVARPDPALEKKADEAIDLICAAQQEDGYLNIYNIVTGQEKRWTNMKDGHELYCLGHLLEGALSYYKATGKDTFLNAMIRYTDLVDKTFGPEPEKHKGYPGHEEIESALIRLHELTGNERYLKLAKHFIDQRGQEPLYFDEEINRYAPDAQRLAFRSRQYQAEIPVREQHDARGHAVRQVYLCVAMAELSKILDDKELFAACGRLWESITERRMYITGSIGSSAHGEAFSFDYDLPNDSAYAETCAAIGLVFFARRMLEISPDSRYGDTMERALYNGVLSGIALDGKSFFYVNPLEVWPDAVEKDPFKSHVKIERQKWFGTSCCPPNVARLLTSLAHYTFTLNNEGLLFMHLFIGGTYKHNVGGTEITLDIETRYPWDGLIKVSVSAALPVNFPFAFRVPHWSPKYTVTINGKEAAVPRKNGYAYLTRSWKTGDTLSINFDMPVMVNRANPAVRENLGKVAVSKGPLIYCLEEADNGKNLHLLYLAENPDFTTVFKPDTLGGISVMSSNGKELINNWPKGSLYRKAEPVLCADKTLTWIPYYAWANRGRGEMRVWVNHFPCP